MNGNEGHIRELERIIGDHRSREFLVDLMNALPNVVAILNEDLRLVYSNQALLDTASMKNVEEALDLRPGELFKCVNAEIDDRGCGYSDACQLCGALSAMQNSRSKGDKVTEICRILSKQQGATKAYNFRFSSTPFINQNSTFYLVTIDDISGKTRKEELEKIFFHDLLNALGGLSGLIGLMERENGYQENHLKLLEELYHNLYNTIMEQKQLSAAERDELEVRTQTINSLEIINSAAVPFIEQANYSASIEIEKDAVELDFESDPTLLGRILTNMLKNALEASHREDTVRIGAVSGRDFITFHVSNPAVMTPEVRLQVFERSFSTKGAGRGLGTYSMKLLGENYLRGDVGFRSVEAEGTTFWIKLPV